MEGAGLGYGLRQPAEIVHGPENCKGKAQQEAGHAAESLSHVLGIVVAVGGLYLVYLLVHLPIHVEDGVSGLKVHLYCGLTGIQRQTALYGHDYGYLVSGIDAPAGDKAVDSRQHGYTTHIGGDKEMQNAYAFVTLYPQAAQVLVQHRDLKALLILVAGIVAAGHYKGHELVEGGQGADQTSVLPVAEAALICTHK